MHAALRRAARAAVRLSHQVEADPLAHLRWMRPQGRFLRHRGKRVLFRAGNQAVGKTYAGLAEVIYRCRGEHPFKPVPKAPIEAWVICSSRSQSIAIQKKLWRLLPKPELQPGVVFDERTGFGFHEALVRFRNGSLIRVKTSGQKTLDLAGATIDVALFDEPPKNERVFAEVSKRVQARGGVVLLTLTPINAPVEWLRELVAKRSIEEVHARLEPDELCYEDGERHRLDDGRLCDQAWIDEVIANSLGHEVPVVCHGEWELRLEGRTFAAFISDPEAPGTHVSSRVPRREMVVCIGIDHGTERGNQAAVLVVVDERDTREGYPHVYVLDEVWAPEITTSERDADSALAMLRAQGWQWDDVDFAYGDIPAGHGAAKKGNRDLETIIARRLGLKDRSKLKVPIRSAKRGRGNSAGMPNWGVKWIHRQMVRGQFHVHPRCVRLIEALNKFDGDSRSDHKHIIDALRYSLTRIILARRNERAAAA